MLIPLIAFIIIIVTVLFVLGAQRKQESKKDIYYGRLKEEYQAEVRKNKSALFSGRTYLAKGTYKETPFSVLEERRKTGRSKSTFTIIRFPSAGQIDFRIAKENFFSRMGKLIGFNDIEFNDHDLDRIFLFKSKDEKAFRSLMSPALLHELNLRKNHFQGAIEGNDEHLQYVFRGSIKGEEEYEYVQSMIRLLEKFDSH